MVEKKWLRVFFHGWEKLQNVWLIFYLKRLIIKRKLWFIKWLFKKIVEIWLKFLLKILLQSFINFISKVSCLKRLIHLKLLKNIFLYIMMLSILSCNVFGCKYWFGIEVSALQYKVMSFWYFWVIIYTHTHNSDYEMSIILLESSCKGIFILPYYLEWGWNIIMWVGLYFHLYRIFL